MKKFVRTLNRVRILDTVLGVAALISLGAVSARATIIDDFTDNTSQATQYAFWFPWSNGYPIDGYPPEYPISHLPVTAGVNSQRSLIGYSAYNATHNHQEMSSGHLTSTLTSNYGLTDNQLAVQYWFDTPLSIAAGSTIWVRGSGSWGVYGDGSSQPGIGVVISSDPTEGWPAYYASIQYDMSTSGSQVDWSFSADTLQEQWGEPLTNITTLMVFMYNRDAGAVNYSTWTSDITKIEVVPEPSALMLIAGGVPLVGVPLLWRRKRRQSFGIRSRSPGVGDATATGSPS